MKVGLIDIDGHNFPNIALMKIATFHKSDNVEMALIENYDKVYCSKIFNYSEDINSSLINSKEWIKGGTGYDIKSKLPTEIENCQLDYSIYPMYDFSVQLFSRGCIRKCPFCVVPEKEGYIKAVDPLNLNPRGKHIEVLDNNFFANPEWRKSIDYLLEVNQPVNLHGVDIRIMTEEHGYYLNKLNHMKQIHIAWDFPEMDLTPKLKEVVKYIKPYKLMCYVLIGYNSTPEQDLFRVETLRGFGIDPFVMPYNKFNKYQKRFARWVNHKAIFKSVEYKEYV
jgi:hypothetical protein